MTISPTKPATIGATLGASASGGALPWDAGGGGAVQAPAALTAPTFAGIPVRGQLLTGTAGTYSGVPAPTLTYQWQSDAGDVGGATSITYTLTSGEDASSMTLIETATNAVGSASQTTAAAITAPAFLTDAADAWHHAGLGVTDTSLEVDACANQATTGGASYDTTATTTFRPDLVDPDTNFNGRATLHFDGGDVLKTAAGAHWEMADGDSFVAGGLFRMDAGAGVKQLMAIDAASGGGFSVSPAISATSRAQVWGDTTGTIRDDGAAIVVSTVSTIAYVLTGAVSAASDSGEIFVSGVTVGTPVTADMDAVAQGGGQEYLVGALTAAGGGGLIGNIAETFFIKRELTAQEDADLTAYWVDYYGATLASGVTK